MGVPKVGEFEGKVMHYSVGALIEKNGKYFLIDRNTEPLGYAGVAGHVDEGESDESALVREVKEEVGLNVDSYELIHEETIPWNSCNKGVEVHSWKVYKCEVSGEVSRNLRETKSAGYFSLRDVDPDRFEPVWKYFFEKLGFI